MTQCELRNSQLSQICKRWDSKTCRQNSRESLALNPAEESASSVNCGANSANLPVLIPPAVTQLNTEKLQNCKMENKHY